MTEEFTRRCFIALGLRTLSDGTLGAVLQEYDLADAKRIGEVRYYDVRGKREHLRRLVIGGEYTVEATGSSIRTSTLAYVRIHPGTTEAERIKWETLHDAALADNATARVEKKMRDSGHDWQRLAPLRAAYTQLNQVGQTALELRVLRYLRTGR